MADKLTNKAEFIDAAMDWLRDSGWSHPSGQQRLAGRLWSRLVKRGLAEERLEPGDYHVKWHTDEDWEPAKLRDDGNWWRLGRASLDWAPVIIGRRIEEPKD